MLLAIDTATRVISLALHDGAQVRAEASWETANHHTVELAPAVAQMLDRAQIAPADLTSVAVALGPGSFTGLRIGLGLAKGMATALELPLFGIPTLEVLAAGQPRFDGLLYPVLKAGRGRICVQPFAWDAEAWEPLDDPAIMGWAEALAAVQEGQPALFSGEIDPDAQALIAAAAQEGSP
ncbi:MAG: tRNA (adenosine(37)-N6)-threonylcarbamoyltransferase complex dimerization subunit type 1 TsaB, partial [Anaerolineae bacterium]|nr:tRNA (adenosine(37)-N6)-threonylcarbamoyltransferase complex dimerization subunit type 1 TsaB [Anaerolineae bacterium]